MSTPSSHPNSLHPDRLHSPHSPHLDTLAVHAGMEGVTEQGSHVPVIDLSTTNPLPGVESGGDSYENLATGGVLNPGDSAVYQRLWQPGVARFEQALSTLEGTEGTVAFSTGMAALSAVLMASVAAGTPHIVALRPLYGGTDHVLDTGLLGTTVTWVDAHGVAAAIRPETGLIILESPANPTLELTDIQAVADTPRAAFPCWSTTRSQRRFCSGRSSQVRRWCFTARPSTSGATVTSWEAPSQGRRNGWCAFVRFGL